MITQIISKYLETHRRLNIPGVGAFISKECGGEILFSELLKKDDGVLRTILTQSGLREIEVAALVDRFVFELRHATESVGGEFEMKNFGTLRREEGGKLIFIASVPEPIQESPIHQETPPEPQEETQPIQETQDIEVVESSDTPTTQQSEITQEESQDTPETAQPSQKTESVAGLRYTPEKVKELYFKPQSFREKDPDMEDLSYSKRRKPLDGYTFVQSEPKKKSVDKVLLFGIFAAVIALAVIAYGYYVNNMEEINSWFGR